MERQLENDDMELGEGHHWYPSSPRLSRTHSPQKNEVAQKTSPTCAPRKTKILQDPRYSLLLERITQRIDQYSTLNRTPLERSLSQLLLLVIRQAIVLNPNIDRRYLLLEQFDNYTEEFLGETDQETNSIEDEGYDSEWSNESATF